MNHEEDPEETPMYDLGSMLKLLWRLFFVLVFSNCSHRPAFPL